MLWTLRCNSPFSIPDSPAVWSTAPPVVYCSVLAFHFYHSSSLRRFFVFFFFHDFWFFQQFHTVHDFVNEWLNHHKHTYQNYQCTYCTMKLTQLFTFQLFNFHFFIVQCFNVSMFQFVVFNFQFSTFGLLSLFLSFSLRQSFTLSQSVWVSSEFHQPRCRLPNSGRSSA